MTAVICEVDGWRYALPPAETQAELAHAWVVRLTRHAPYVASSVGS